MASGVDAATADAIGDSEGLQFWSGSFGPAKQTTFRAFVDSFQAHLTATHSLRAFRPGQLRNMLRHCILDSSSSSAVESTLLGTDITLGMFAKWLGRYGPVSQAHLKMAAVVLPDSGEAAPWFHRNANREDTARVISGNLARNGRVLSAASAVVVRYSADSNFHFVVSVQLPQGTLEHFPVVNSAEGYNVLAQSSTGVSPHATVLDCAQSLLDQLMNDNSDPLWMLSRSSLLQWLDIFKSLSVALPENHYLGKGTNVDSIARYTTPPVPGAAAAGAPLAMPTTMPVGPPLGGMSSSMNGRGGGSDNQETAIVGRYMVRHGLNMLLQSGELDAATVTRIQQML